MFPLERSNRQLSMYDPETGKITLINTCFQTHHLVFAEDANNTLWTSAGGPQSGVIGWLNRKMFEETGDEEKSQGWTALILDTNANGKRDAYVEPNEPVDPAKDKRVNAAIYSVAVNPVDGSIWGTSLGFPGYVVRLDPGAKSSRDGLGGGLRAAVAGIWAARRRHRPQWRLLGISVERPSRQLRPAQVQGSAERAQRDGQTLPGGLDTLSSPRTSDGRRDRSQGSAEASYYTWVDQFDTFGLGKNVPIATGNANESLLALVDGKFVNLRVPYPMGFYPKWMDGRIDDANAGWKGQGAMGDLQHQDALPHRGRQGDDEQGCEAAAAPRSTREVTAQVRASV